MFLARKGGLSKSFYDLAAGGGTTVALTKDGATHDADLSLTVPLGANAVLLQCSTEMSNATSYILAYMKGSGASGASRIDSFGTSSSGGMNGKASGNVVVALDTTRIISYQTTNLADAYMRILGYWM